MRKIIVLVTAIILLNSCGLFKEASVTNNSSHTVEFKWGENHHYSILLTPGESSSVNHNVYRVANLQPGKRVYQVWNDGNNISIVDRKTYVIHVENQSSGAINLTADGWLESDMVVPVGNFADLPTQKGISYTQNPPLSVSGNSFPVKVEKQLINGIIHVKIY